MRGPGAVEKAKDFKGTMAMLLKYMRKYLASIIIVFVFAIMGTVFAIYSPKLMGNITNQIVSDVMDIMFYESVQKNLPVGVTLPDGATGEYVFSLMDKMPPGSFDGEALSNIPPERLERFKAMDVTKRPGIRFDLVLNAVQLLILLYVLSALFQYVQGFVMTGISQKICYSFRKDISQKINRMPLRYFDTRTNGDVLSRVTNDVDTIGQTLTQSLSQLVSSVTMLVGILIMMLTISWQLALVVMCVLPVSMGLSAFIMSKSQKHFKRQQDSLGNLNGHIEECYSGHTIIKVFNAEKRSVDQFVQINDELYKSAWKSQFLSGIMMPLMGFISNLAYVAICLLGGWLAVNGTLQVGDIQSFIIYIRQFTQPISQLATVMNTLQSTAAAAERVFEFLSEEEETPESATPAVLESVCGEVGFENVVFGYDPDKVIIKGFNAGIKAGVKVAIVGPTGAGKTTIVNLLMRFYDVNEGRITLDGTDIRDMRRAELRSSFGMVLQDAWLFNGTIEENIRYGKAGASEAEVRAAAKAAQVDHFISSMPGG